MGVQLDVRHLKLVAAVAEEGSVTAAARRLHLTQSALSHQLRDAEEKLGARLFLRLGRRMQPTPAGEQMLETARRVLAELEGAEGRIRRQGRGEGGVLRLSTACYTCYHWLPELLREFRQRHGGVEVRIDAQATHRPVEALLEGRLDLAITSMQGPDPRLRIRPLFEDELVVVLPPRHPLARAEFIRPQQLAGETVIIYPPREDSFLLNLYLKPAGVEPAAVLEMPLTEAVVEMVKAGLGVGFLARWAVAPCLTKREIAARPMTRQGCRRQWSAVTLRRAQPPGYIEDFITMLADEKSPFRAALRGAGGGPRIAAAG
ncbi:MAG TPA: LysR family transcriptional regulator [Terriglobales bacterium]|nr:LysR family transcriptional regulator [Terriglobales bacterium]